MRGLIPLLILLGCGGASPSGTSDPKKSQLSCPSQQPKAGDSCTAPGFCYYYDACTRDSTGVTASCENGKFQVGYDLVAELCGKTPPADGDPCPCGTGGRQSDCSFTCAEGGSLDATCDSATLKWKIRRPATCTIKS
jgi:hypothetical protein